MSNNTIQNRNLDSNFLSNNYNSDSSESMESENETEIYSSFENSGSASTINLTPFNMKEELEEGYFDSEGTYHLKKKAKFSDYWLENIDNYNVQKGQIERDFLPNKSTAVELFDTNEAYKKIMNYLQPKETIAQALCRLGKKNSMTTMERLKLKKLGTLADFDNSKQITELTGLANDIFAKTGDIDIYQKTSKDITEMLNDTTKLKKEICVCVKDTVPELDMFSDDFVEKEKSILEENPTISYLVKRD